MLRLCIILFCVFFSTPSFGQEHQVSKFVVGERPLAALFTVFGKEVDFLDLGRTAGCAHDFIPLKPSERALLEGADLILTMGSFNPALLDPIKTILYVNLHDTLLDEEGRGHGPEEHDMHPWLVPDNLLIFAADVREFLILRDPKNKKKYTDQYEAFQKELDAAVAVLKSKAAPLSKLSYWGEDDAIERLEEYLGITAVGRFFIHTDASVSPTHMKEVSAHLSADPPACVLVTTQDVEKLEKMKKLARDMKPPAPTFVFLDITGQKMPLTPDFYSRFFLNIAAELEKCALAVSP